MQLSLFFIRRPVFAWVIAIAIMLAGALGITTLPISQYPEIAPPTVRITATYPGASAQTVENSVTRVIEQNMTGLENLDYFTASSSSDGRSTIALTFNSRADPDIAQVNVQNQLQLVESQLPQPVIDQGIRVTKSTTSILMVVTLTSTDGSLSSNDLGDFISTNIEDVIRRVNGVGDLNVFGSGYAMRIWLDPERLERFQLTPADVTSAVRAQNTQVSVGQLGANPAVPGQQLNATITAQSQLQTPEQFRNIILKTETGGAVVRLSDVARVEIGAESYATSSQFNAKPAAGFGVNLLAGANAIDTANGVRAAMERLKATLPENVEVVYAYDTTPFVQLSIHEVERTLVEAIVLVFLVMLLFLQNIRATFIPTIAVPVVLLGTFGVLALAGYSINTLTMFAMVLAIGLLVDDAIVVVENVERLMAEEGLSPREATEKSMGEITGALIGIALVLSAVFVPMAFFGGSVGIIYRQFSITIVSAMLLSVIVALVLTPALTATILKRQEGEARFFLFRWLNKGFGRTTSGYERAVGGIIRRPLGLLLVFLLIAGGAGYLFRVLPSSFIPAEDQGVLMVQVQLPSGATEQRTRAVLSQISDYFLNKEKQATESVFAAIGFGFAGSGQNAAMAFVRLKPFEERTDPALAADALAMRAMRQFATIRDAQIFALAPPAIPGLGTAGGFDMYLQDAAGAGRDALVAARNTLLAKATQDPQLSGVRQNAQDDQAEFRINVDGERAGAFGVGIAEINAILSTAWAGTYVNDFIDRGQIKPVWVQADAPFRMQPQDINRWYARNTQGEMVPFSAFTSTDWSFGPPKLDRFNGVAAVEIQGSAAPGVSSGTAMDRMEELVTALGNGFTPAWTGLSYQERLSGNQAPALYAISVVVVFLCLAALYESWSIPFSVILSVPVGVFGALLAAWLFGQSNDVYFKVALLTTIGLASKNAILIVEFARDLQASGRSVTEAILEAARLRFRPIVMTSLAFIFGVLPLATATGASSGAQNSIGIGVAGGMLAATLLGVFFVPLFFVVVSRLSARFTRRAAKGAKPEAQPPAEPA
ncbi:efflux RND transporter permease subunit [Mesorhizobium sp. BAC0120]|uniref:efflux RND transporter permease subunit n=1 Tax=Mesorhizobium sp. BAC0120 TaxID=3090670 RepID=UPI00298BCB94|nr:efflux RND transporter permease subunit [Mesorhizobium sp. BAC0120]MDW6026613.1 efflux RND transporter permease subunit [Mesorhizobium sp. BAC0120]